MTISTFCLQLNDIKIIYCEDSCFYKKFYDHKVRFKIVRKPSSVPKTHTTYFHRRKAEWSPLFGYPYLTMTTLPVAKHHHCSKSRPYELENKSGSSSHTHLINRSKRMVENLLDRFQTHWRLQTYINQPMKLNADANVPIRKKNLFYSYVTHYLVPSWIPWEWWWK